MSNTTRPSSQLSVEKLGPPGLKGELHVLAITAYENRTDSERLNDTSTRSFKVAAQLSKTPLPAGPINGDFGPNDGGSYLHIPANYVMSRVRCPDGMFEIKKNERGEQSLVVFECDATSVATAKAKFLRAVLPFIDHLAFLANCPLFVTMVRVEDPANLRTSFDYTAPYREVVVNPGVSLLRQELAPVYALYRDAKNSHSPFYSFLCYHKILDGLLGTIRAGLRARAAKRGIQLTSRREVVPESPDVATAFRPYVGKSIKVFFDDVMTPQYRNAVAHFIARDGSILNLSMPEEMERYSSVLYVSELCVRTVIDGHEKWLTELEAET